MHIVYNALKTQGRSGEKNNITHKKYKAYTEICNKYKHEIAAIQKYIPGWQPAFNY